MCVCALHSLRNPPECPTFGDILSGRGVIMYPFVLLLCICPPVVREATDFAVIRQCHTLLVKVGK